MIAISSAVVVAGSLLLKLPDATVMIGVGAALILMDGVFRVRARPAHGWLTQTGLGGYFFFVPVWAVGAVVIAANLISLLARRSVR